MKTCCNGYRVMIELQKQELVYDIKNTAYIFADAQTKTRFRSTYAAQYI